MFSLGRRCRPHSRGKSNPRYSGADARRTGLRYGAVTLYRAPFQETSRRRSDDGSQSEHHIAREGFGLDWVAFTRRYSRYPVRFLFLPVLRCFSSRRSPLRKAIARGFLFGDPWFLASMRLPRAYRSLARPSSALEPSHSPAGTVATLEFVTVTR